ncbi:hybrid sensor histidine kinase/response regulator [Candidatus Dependentiae bacterium]|nr:hybrid sensor histidine kinase/response regulator [Candidatus Dependentiae bacterium]
MSLKELLIKIGSIDKERILNDPEYKIEISNLLKELNLKISLYPRLSEFFNYMSIIVKSDDSFKMDLFMESYSDLIRIYGKQKDFSIETDKEFEMLNQKLALFSEDALPGELFEKEAETDENAESFDYSELELTMQDFIDEMEIMISHLENDILNLESAEPVKINTIFRCLHTIKGAVGMVKLVNAQRLAHIAENLFDKIRSNRIKPNQNFEDVFLECVDRFKNILSKVKRRENPFINVDDLIEKLQYLEQSGGELPDFIEVKNKEESKTEKSLSPNQEKDNESMSLRVDITKLDNVMNQMGELIIEKIKLEQQFICSKNFMIELRNIKNEFNKKKINDILRKEITLGFIEKFEKFHNNFSNVIDEISRTTMNMQDSVMKIRLVPLSTIFNRFPRLMKDISKKVKKEIDFQIIGAETEIDKGICEMLFNPLLHILRNSIDHGIEDAKEERIRKGKNSAGKIIIKAYYRSDKVVIDIIDDGAGIDEDKVVAKAVEKNIISADDVKTLDKKSKLMMIFQPGFSTAKKVTDLSGRGVGMDVVRSTIEKLKGTVDIITEKGIGTTMSLSLPLTLAIVRILIFSVKSDVLAVPVYNVRETVQISSEDIHEANGKPVINLRGEMIPLIYLSDVLGINGFTISENVSVIIVEVMDRQYGLIVSKFVENREVVIKNIGNLLKKVPFISGTAILGDGEIIPILDTVAVMNYAKHQNKKTSVSSKISAHKLMSKKNKKRVLVVEDSKMYSNQIAEILIGLGYEVDIAENGEAGLKKLKLKKFDLISSDIIMPVMDGYEFVKRLRKMKEYELTPVIGLTSMKEKVDKIKGFESGMDEYLNKPIDIDEYIRVIKKMLETA